MKKTIIFSFICAAALMAASCGEDDPEDKILDPDLSIKVSDRIVIFDGETKIAKIGVSSTIDSWNVENDANWFSAEKSGNGTVLITLLESEVDSGTEAFVFVTAVEGQSAVKDSVYVKKIGDNPHILSEKAPANCYIAATRGEYRFDATVKGNGTDEDGGSLYLESAGADNSQGLYADLLWESTADADKTRSCDIIDGRPVYKNGNIWFTTGGTEGNALIALKQADGRVVWSWHIWVTDTPVETSDANGFKWMDRNLGALNNDPGDIGNIGMLYQWGRKDPMLPFYLPYEEAAEFSNPPDNTQTGNGTGTWDYGNTEAQLLDRAPGNMPMAVRNPMSFVTSFGSVGQQYFDWYIPRQTEDQFDSFLWGKPIDDGKKTIFDPCPPGYRIPPHSAWDSVHAGDLENQWTPGEDGEYGSYWTGGTGDFFPSPGYRMWSSGAMSYPAARGSYWTSTPEEDSNSSYRVYFTASTIRLDLSASPRAYGYNVRCVEE